MTNTPMPANIRKRSEIYAQNVTKRGHVKTSLDPKAEQRIEAERLRKKGIGKGSPTLVSRSRKLLFVLLALVLGSTLYQMLLPLFGSSSSSSSSSSTRSNKKGPSKQEPELTREQQARAAEAVIRAMNQQKIEKYRENAKNYKGEAVVGPDDEDFVSVSLAVSPDSDEETPVVKAKPQML
ncbi:hypothetical protein GGI23_000140 [Coemansia sp. RSA 2559]|nr:hypothetical protein GGI23_000140 [Coemansia sp. RSA 2559]KAJ2869735.1 hypothetical protein GGI22_000076 [Coemansia erecta]